MIHPTKLKPFSGSGGTQQEGAREHFHLPCSCSLCAPGALCSPAACAPRCHQPSVPTQWPCTAALLYYHRAKAKLQALISKGNMVSLKQGKLICAQAAVDQKCLLNNAWAGILVYITVVFNEMLLLPSTAF